jgi:hypothetical protein
MDETLSQKKWGEKRFRALQTDRTTRVFSAFNSEQRHTADANRRGKHAKRT